MFLGAMLSQAFKLESMPGQKLFLSFSVFEASYQCGKGERAQRRAARIRTQQVKRVIITFFSFVFSKFFTLWRAQFL